MKNVTVLIMDDQPDSDGDVFDPKGVKFPEEVKLVHDLGRFPEAYIGTATRRQIVCKLHERDVTILK